MDPVTLISLITTAGPFVVAGVKKIFKTDEIIAVSTKKQIHVILPLAVGLAASIGNAYMTGGDWSQAIMEGLAGGAGAAYARDFDKNVLGLVRSLVFICTRGKITMR